MTTVDLYHLPHETLAVYSPARPCRYCGVMCFVLTNRGGQTSCVSCADYIERNMEGVKHAKDC